MTVTGPLMPRKRKRLVQIVAGLLWATGVAWLVLHYFLRTQGAFGAEANPAEPLMLSAHGGFAFLALVGFGYLWAVHVIPGWARGERRVSGGVMIGGVILLIATGYLLYYLGDENLRAIASAAHWVLGIAALALFLAHRRWRNARVKTPPSTPL